MTNLPPHEDPNQFRRYSFGLTALIVVIVGVAGAQTLNLVAEKSAAPIAAFLAPLTGRTLVAQAPSKPGGVPHFDNVDYGATGSIHNFLEKPIVLDPCTGKQK